MVEDCLASKARQGLRPRYLTQLRSSFTLFAAGREGAALADISPAEIEQWLYGRGIANRTRRNYLIDVRTLFSFARTKGLLRENPAAAVAKPAVEGQAPGVLSLADVWRVLERASALGVGHYFGVMLFAGLRPGAAEQAFLGWVL